MKARKTFLTAATAVTLAIAGTSVASAQEELPDDGSTGSSASNEESGSAPTAGSAELSAERDVFGSVTGADALGSWTGDQFDYGKATEALVSLAVGGAAVATLAGAYTAAIDASDAFQGVLQDSRNFIESQLG
ncbi:hypothetical protein [Corynebacterium glyciniphilum]|uniref:hypothetical protein n=1 Tax=Corynebacterium glyciniphilum TaxID=1404244 RepID=UPI00264AD96F|nr:hypothetical protein [Corynebacterium glyciniphilum]MDN5682870.1 hypothetical protein [Corynebacterium glyciniphilum]MDN6705187.1 hypothetical protein [Corynebacterium glyciniphilum]